MKKTMMDMSHKIGGSKLPNEEKISKLMEFFEVNKKALSVLGPDTFISIKDDIGDIIKNIRGL
jgi:hypothetical protein